jgi:glycosyltransferase involved in cell wall biosynthesis
MSAPKRVLLAGDFPERPPMTVGGIQAVTWQLAGALAEIEDFEIHAVACERFWQAPPRRRWRSRLGVGNAHYLHTPTRIPHVVSSWTSDAEYVRHTIRTTRAQLVHAHGQVGYTIGAIRSGVPHVVTPHGMLRNEKHAPMGTPLLSRARLRQTLWGATEDWCLAHARHIVVISPYVRRLVEPRTRAQLHDIPNPVDPGFFALSRGGLLDPGWGGERAGGERSRSDRSEGPSSEGPSHPRVPEEPAGPVLLTVGWVNARKRHELILRALPLVRERLPGTRLRIVGNVEARDGQLLEHLRKLVRELGVGEAVDFLSELSHEQLLDEYRGASLYVHAAAEESSPVAVAQAMAAGLPLCAIDIPGLHHLLRAGHTGLYAREDNAREDTSRGLAAAIVEVLESRALARSLGAQARREALARFHPAAVASVTAELYREVLAQARR